MRRRQHANWWAGAALGVALLLGGTGVRAAEATPPSAPPKDSGTPALYGFCMEIFDARKRPLPEQTQLLRELGFDGVGYPLWLDDSLEKNLRTLDDAGLKLYLVYATVKVKSDGPVYDPRVPDAIRKLKGRPTTVCVLLQGLPPGDPRGEEVAVKTLRQLGDVAAEVGLRISIYHHTGDWTASLLHTLQVVQKANHPQVGANFNLCHWLMVDGEKDYRPVLREHAAKIFVVTINGAQLGTKTWTNGLIQPLDQGNFDNRQLLATLREIGYRGPIGLMCYGIPGDAREHLERSRKVWRSWHE
jgi:sugar phosphate isomerase/epimerase